MSQRKVITAPGAPEAAGPYSHGVTHNGLLFCSGQVPLDPDTGELIDGTIADQTVRCLDNLEAVCVAAGARLADAVRVTLYLTDMGTFAQVNEAYGAFFAEDPPARVAVGVAALPLDARVEAEAIVALAD